MKIKLVVCISLAALLAVCSCSLKPAARKAIEDDFMESVTKEERARADESVRELKQHLRNDFKNVELHRRLAVQYRLMGTPRARLLSLEEIETAIRLDPIDPSNHVERGLTMRARSLIGEAEASFKRALEIDPKCFEAWYQLGKMEQEEYQKTLCFPDHLRNAIHYYKKAYRLDRRHEDNLFRLGFLHMFREMFRTAKKYALNGIRCYPENPGFHLLLATIHYQFLEFEESDKEFARAFELLGESEAAVFLDISTLLPGVSRDDYLFSTDERKIDWNRKFWIENDPTPATDLNERRIEHYRRVFLSSTLFDNKRLGLKGPDTHLGMALISYGFPARKFYDLAGGLVGPWIVWEYELPYGSFRLFFQDEFLNGNFHIPIYERYLGGLTLKILESIPQLYSHPVKYTLLPLKVEKAQFRGKDERTRLELSIAMPDTVLDKTEGNIDLLLTFFDSDWNRVSSNHFIFTPDSLLRIERLNETFAVYHFWIELISRPLGYNCALEVIDEDSNYKGTWRSPIDIKDLYGRSLKLSSIRLNVLGEDENCLHVLDPIPVYAQGRRLCISYEIYNLKRDESNQSRYNLTYMIKERELADNEKSKGLRGTLGYMWRSIRGKKGDDEPYISSSFVQRINERTAADSLQIDIGSLECGKYTLILEVKDLVSNELVFVEKLFLITE